MTRDINMINNIYDKNMFICLITYAFALSTLLRPVQTECQR